MMNRAASRHFFALEMDRLSATDVASLLSGAAADGIASVRVFWWTSSPHFLVTFAPGSGHVQFLRGAALRGLELHAERLLTHCWPRAFTEADLASLFKPAEVAETLATAPSLAEFVRQPTRPRDWGERAEDDGKLPPERLRDAYAGCLMLRPVIAADGRSYDRRIWLELMRDGLTDSPVTGEPLAFRHFAPDDEGRRLLSAYRVARAWRPLYIGRALGRHAGLAKPISRIVVAYLLRQPPGATQDWLRHFVPSNVCGSMC